MSRKIDAVFQQAYDAEVKRAYGQKQMLAGTTQEKTVEDAKSIFFRKKGKGMARLHTPGADRTAMNVEYGQVECVLQDWEAIDFIDKFDIKKFNFSEAKECAEVAADAIGLRLDQIKIDAIANGYNTSKMKIGKTKTPMTVAYLREAIMKLNDNGVDNRDRYCLFTPQQLNDLLGTTEATSSDYNNVQTLVNGEMNSGFLGLKYIMIAGNRQEGGLPNGTAEGDKIAFVFQKDAVGFAMGQKMTPFIEWTPEKGGWYVGADVSAGAVVVDDEGIVGIETGVAAA